MKVLNYALSGLLCLGLVTAHAQVVSPSNTVVRFQIATGQAAVGDVDVELFDQEKPETVRQFLMHVRSGSYSNVLLHSLEPGFVLRGGQFTNSAAVTSSNPFLEFGSVRNLGPVTNEFGTGTQLSNTAGTLAMSKLGSNPQMSGSQWFFNLADNSGTLDPEGYTVFGRVLPATNGVGGTNLLATFNASSISNGIVDMTQFFGPGWGSFTDLPVNYTGHSVPESRQLYYATVFELEPSATDNIAPTVTIDDPAEDVVVTNSTRTVTGTASDDQGVARVIYSIGQAEPVIATGTTNWSIELNLFLGTNVISVQSVDAFGNVSAPVQRRIRYVLPNAVVQTNTVVRFEVSTGDGPVGQMDVELFDTDKPETVRNFLLYVRNGSYKRVLLHRLVPGFVLQGGGYTNTALPTSSSPFLEFGEVRNLGQIINEFNSGPRLSNTFGTIAMAKVGNNANSASSQWFFNLGNNTANLDTQNGGFTVFGRVLPGTNSTSGTNLLTTFNSLSQSNGIIDMTGFFGAFWSAFTDLPVNYVGYAVPQNKQLYYVTVTELNPPFVDTNSPAVAITSPLPNVTVTNASLTVTGTASDAVGLSRVLYFFGDSTPRIASGTTNWSFNITLTSGTNIISVQSVDLAGNLSPIVQRSVVFGGPLGSSGTNTIVRFHFTTADESIGNVDVELFDRDKPETVRNFLLYVRSGLYTNLIVHRLVPRFVLQSGGYTNLQPTTSSNEFTIPVDIPDFGMITNEFLVGPRYSNQIGTIAMAKLGGNPNSASSEWFFNLGNNTTNLDVQNGGFTVFGRVLATTNQMAGTNLLNTFNSLTKSNGIVDMSWFYGSTWSAFTDLPVDFVGARIPQDRELYYVSVSELTGSTNVDTTLPTIAITNAPADLIVTNRTFTLAGTAEDDVGLARVLYYFNDTMPFVAVGTTNWSIPLTLRRGTNYITVQSVDRFGNRSAPLTQILIQSTLAAITLKVEGPGQVFGITNNELLEVGQSYTMRARPNNGAFFGGWSGSANSSSNEVTFVMQTNTSITATFKYVPFPSGRGVYRGLFVASNQPSPASAGLFTIVAMPSRSHSGKLLYFNSNFVYRGFFDNKGVTALQGTLFGQSMNMSLRLDVTESPGRVAGVVFAGGGVAALEAYKVTHRLTTTTRAQAGSYTFLLAGSTNAATSPGGQGYGTVRIGRNAKVKVNGVLGDGTVLKQTSKIVGDDRWPVHSRLFGKRGQILGWSIFDTNSAFNGTLFSFKPAQSTDSYYPGGYTNSMAFRGAPYFAPHEGERVFNWTNGTVILQGGNLQRALLYRVELAPDHSFTVLAGPEVPLTLHIEPQTGRIFGSFTHPVTQLDTPLEGIAVQGIDEGGGLFYGPDQTGAFSVQKQ